MDGSFLEHSVVEATTAKFVFQWLKNNRYQQGTIEMDSLLVVDMMKNRTSQNRNLKFIVDETADLVGNADFCCTHCYKEVNTVADHLAKLAIMKSGPMLYSRLDQLTSGIKGVYLLYKIQVPSIGIRYDKAHFFVS
ncbi:hypothetical protein KY284_001290 [Solanum tuberosum]|nr:hypothetical protein KY284_001290 [Solanum tuberosum]